jgi:hypothetical protein
MKRLLVLLALLLGGCETDVPVEVERALPDPPPECLGTLDNLPTMKSFPSTRADGALLTVVDVNAAWAGHEITAQAVARRNAAHAAVCTAYVKSIIK